MITMGRFPTRWGGIEKLVQALCPLLAARDVDLTVVSRPNPKYAPVADGAMVIHAPPARGKASTAVAYTRTVLRVAADLKPQVIHAQSLLSPTTAAVLAGRDLAVEVQVLQRMVLGAHGEPHRVAVGGQSLGHRPGREHPVAFEPDVPVQAPGVVLLDDEAGARPLHRRVGVRDRLRGAPRVALAAVFVQRHPSTVIRTTSCART